MASRLVRSGLACPPTCEPARAASDVLQSKSILELPPSQRHGPFCSVEASNLRIKSHLPAAHAGLSAIGSGIWTDACASRSRSAQGFLQLCSRMWMSRPRSIHKAHSTALLTSNCTGTVYLTLVTPWWILLPIVITSQERSRDSEPEGPTHVERPTSGPVLPSAQ